MPATVKKAIEDYLHSDGFLQMAKSTREQHQRTLAILGDICGPRMVTPRLTRVEVDAAINFARERLKKLGPVKEYSLNAYRAPLKAFVRFCHTAGYLPGHTNPTAHLRTARFTKDNPKKRKPLSVDQTLRLFAVAKAQHPRDWIACVVLAYTGMRASELQELRVGNVHWDDKEIVFYRPKQRDWHTAPFTPELEEALLEWFEWYRGRHPEMDPKWRLVPARIQGHPGGMRMNPDWPINPTHKINFLPIFKGLLMQIGVNDLEGKGAHTLRRTFAEMLLEMTDNIRAVQEALGHRFQSTTEGYLDINVQRDRNRKTLGQWRLVPAEVPENVIPLRRAG